MRLFTSTRRDPRDCHTILSPKIALIVISPPVQQNYAHSSVYETGLGRCCEMHASVESMDCNNSHLTEYGVELLH